MASHSGKWWEVVQQHLGRRRGGGHAGQSQRGWAESVESCAEACQVGNPKVVLQNGLGRAVLRKAWAEEAERGRMVLRRMLKEV
jgi:hypothetical protein